MILVLQNVGLVASVACALLLALKLTEMVKNVHWAATVDQDVVERLHRALIKGSSENFATVLKMSNFPFFPGSFAFSRWMTREYKLRYVRSLVGVTRDLAFRYPVLMVASSIFITMILADRQENDVPDLIKIWSILLASLTFLGVWVKVLHLLIYRFKFGLADNYLLSMSVPVMRPEVTEALNRRRALQKFLIVVLSSLVAFLFAYSSIYLLFAKGLISGQGLKGISLDVPFIIQTFYFSTATFLTVGFGDISATGSVAFLAVTSEMLLSLLLLVIFVTAFAATVPSDE